MLRTCLLRWNIVITIFHHSLEFGKVWREIFYSPLFSFLDYVANWLYFLNLQQEVSFYDVQQNIHAISSPCLFCLLNTRTLKYHLILTSCTKILQHRKCFVFCSIWPIFLGWHQLILLVHWTVSAFMFGKATGKLFLDIFKGNNKRAGLIL